MRNRKRIRKMLLNIEDILGSIREEIKEEDFYNKMRKEVEKLEGKYAPVLKALRKDEASKAFLDQMYGDKVTKEAKELGITPELILCEATNAIRIRNEWMRKSKDLVIHEDDERIIFFKPSCNTQESGAWGRWKDRIKEQTKEVIFLIDDVDPIKYSSQLKDLEGAGAKVLIGYEARKYAGEIKV